MDRSIKIAVIEWLDPHSVDEWSNVEDIQSKESCLIQTVGILIDQSKTRIIVALNQDPDDLDVSCTMVIPKSAIIAMEILKIERPKKITRTRGNR